MCSYVNGPYDKVEGFERLNKALLKIEDESAPGKPANRVFYLALPPSVFMPVTENIKAACMSQRYKYINETEKRERESLRVRVRKPLLVYCSRTGGKMVYTSSVTCLPKPSVCALLEPFQKGFAC